MTLRVTSRHLVAACVIVPWAVALVWVVYRVASPSPEERIAIEHQKLRHMLEQFVQAERALKAGVDKLEASAPGIDYGNLYQRLDLSTLDGVHAARQRTIAFRTQMENFAKIHEQFWMKVQAIVDKSDLSELLQGQLKANLTLDETDVYPKYRAWTRAALEDVEAVERYLDVNEHYLGQFKWGENSLTFTNPQVPRDIAKAQAALGLTEDHYEQTGSAALKNTGNTEKFVLTAMRSLEIEGK